MFTWQWLQKVSITISILQTRNWSLERCETTFKVAQRRTVKQESKSNPHCLPTALLCSVRIQKSYQEDKSKIFFFFFFNLPGNVGKKCSSDIQMGRKQRWGGVRK